MRTGRLCTEEANKQSPKTPGVPGTHPDTRRNLTDVGVGYLDNAYFDQFFPPMLDTPVYTDCENIKSTLREEPPKKVTFCGDLGHRCSVDDSGWNLSTTRETAESTTTTHPSYQGSPQPRREHGSKPTPNSCPCRTPNFESRYCLQVIAIHEVQPTSMIAIFYPA